VTISVGGNPSLMSSGRGPIKEYLEEDIGTVFVCQASCEEPIEKLYYSAKFTDVIMCLLFCSSCSLE